jgi:hypothetical protein
LFVGREGHDQARVFVHVRGQRLARRLRQDEYFAARVCELRTARLRARGRRDREAERARLARDLEPRVAAPQQQDLPQRVLDHRANYCERGAARKLTAGGARGA